MLVLCQAVIPGAAAGASAKSSLHLLNNGCAAQGYYVRTPSPYLGISTAVYQDCFVLLQLSNFHGFAVLERAGVALLLRIGRPLGGPHVGCHHGCRRTLTQAGPYASSIEDRSSFAMLPFPPAYDAFDNAFDAGVLGAGGSRKACARFSSNASLSSSDCKYLANVLSVRPDSVQWRMY